jgi:agmatinase
LLLRGGPLSSTGFERRLVIADASSTTTSEADISFLGLENAPLERADVAVLCAPFEATVSYGKGTARGPQAILVGTTHLETFEEEMAWDFEGNLAVATLPEISRKKDEPAEIYLRRLRETAAGLGLAPPFPLTLGGEHSITPAVMGGIFPDAEDLTVVQIDAHADLRDEYDGSAWNHACAMRRVLDLNVRRLVALGIRSAETEEFALARDDDRIVTHHAHTLQDPGRWAVMIEELTGLEGPVYLTVDIDGLDVPWCPGTGTPMPGGLTWYQTLEIVRTLARAENATLVGADIMETVPQPHSQVNEMVAAKLAQKILSYHFHPKIT